MSDNTTSNKWETLNQEKTVEQELVDTESAPADAQDQDSAADAFASDDDDSELSLSQALQQAKIDLQQAHERQTRMQAELQNTVRRYKRELENRHKFGAKDLIESLLPVIDSLEQASILAEQQQLEAMQPMQEGISLTLKLLLDALAKHGLVQDDPVGKLFDPQRHEAMSIQEDPQAPPNTVITVFQKGYQLAERVIRPARVIVAKGKTAKVDENT